jgi:DeoR/GlpR family transcriptional regulator of sugar metabolism
VAALRSIHLDLVFMSVHGMDLRSGFTTRNVLEADTDRALVASGRRLVVLADSSKWGVIGISSIARLDEADTLVTDPGLSADARQLVGEQVREVVIAPVGNANRPA